MTNEKALILVNERIKGIDFFKDVEPWKDQYAMWLIVKEALEKQIPKRPRDKVTYLRCCGCGNHIDYSYISFGGTGDEVKFNYCSNCGQKIDWSEDD